MAHFAKPSEGSWTEHYPELGTGPVSYEDSISPEHYELERKAIFGRTWLNVGRVEQLPRSGSYFTKELDAAGTSIVVVRGPDGTIRSFHNMCRHRGNKLVWNDYPQQETSGTCRQFTCKYHGWRYSVEGQLTFVQQESEFFDLDKEDYGLAAIAVETWEGFIFVNLDPDNTTSVQEYLGDLGAGMVGYPFDKMTQVYKYRADVGANWKLFIDAFAEFYHAPILHAKQADRRGVPQALRFRIRGAWPTSSTAPTAWCRPGAGCRRRRTSTWSSRSSGCLRSGLFGPWDRPDIDGLDQLPPAINPARHRAWGVDSFVFFPNFMVLVWQTGLVPDVPLLADVVQHAHLRRDAVLRPPEECPRAPAAGAGRGHVQGVRAAGRQHAGGDPDDARVEGRFAVPPQRPGDPAPATSQDGPRLRRGLSEELRHAGPDLGRFLSTETKRNANPAD